MRRRPGAASAAWNQLQYLLTVILQVTVSLLLPLSTTLIVNV
jgi:hypothetical protein